MGKPKRILTDTEKKPVKKKKDDQAIALELDLSIQTQSDKIEPKKETDTEISSKKDIEKEELSKKATKSDDKALFTLDKPIYLQLNSGNIFQIFGSGLIAPSKYIKRTFNDIQTHRADEMVFSNGAIGQLDDTQVLLELNILDIDKPFLEASNSLAFISVPLPISRIKRVYVSSRAVKDEILKTALVNDGGIIPESLITAEFPEMMNSTLSGEPLKSNEIDYTSQLELYDRILGSFAFLKNYSLLQANKTNRISSLPEHYIYGIQAISNLSPFKLFSNERILSFYKKLFGVEKAENPFLRWIIDRINMRENFTDEDVKDFASTMNTNNAPISFIDAAKPIMNEMLKNIERKAAIRKIPFIVEPEKFYLFVFAFLRTYGNTSTEEKSIVRLDIKDMEVNGSGEYIFSLLGYFYGYSTLRNFDEKIQLNDAVFSGFFENLNRPSIKFDLTTLFDFITIESVYSFVFRNRKFNDAESTMLSSASIKSEWLRKPMNLPSNYKFTADPPLYGKTFYRLSRRSELDDFLEKITRIKNDIPALSVFGNICFRHGLKMQFMPLDDFARIGNVRFFMYFKKTDVIEAVKVSKMPVGEAISALIESLKFKEFE